MIKEHKQNNRGTVGTFGEWVVRFATVGLLGWVLYRYNGYQVFIDLTHRLKYSWVLLLIPVVGAGVFTFLGYRTSLPERGKSIHWFILIQIERSGAALNALLPLGNSSGNIVKIALLRHWFSSEAIVAAGIWGGLATGVCNTFGALGPAVTMATGYSTQFIVALLIIVNVVISIPALTILTLVKRGLSERVAKVLSIIPSRFVASRRGVIIQWASRLDQHLRYAVEDRKGDFARLLGFRVLYQINRILEIWLVITLIDLPGGLMAALIYNAMSRSVTQLLAFVPGRLGVMEWASIEVFSIIGWAPEAGLSLALALRFHYFVNLLVSFTALSNVYTLAKKYPPRYHAKQRDSSTTA